MDLVTTTLQSVFRLAAPEAVLVFTAFLVFLGGAFRQDRALWGIVSMLGLAGATLVFAFSNCDHSAISPTVSVLWIDRLATFARVTAWAGGAVLLLASWDELPDAWAAEYFGCLLVMSAGIGLVGAANELITMFLALEMVSIPTYVMLYLPRANRQTQEATIKYFLLSIVSSALLLFGFSYLYGVTGTTNLSAIHNALDASRATIVPMLVLVAVVFIIAGLAFRITAVPFHFYAPDVFEGTANGPAAMLAFAPKVAGFVALIRLLGFAGPPAIGDTLTLNLLVSNTSIPLMLWILAAVTMTVGNIVATWQDDLKRLLAYSAIAHSGYMLIGLAVAPFQFLHQDATGAGTSAVLFYLLAYSAMTIGAFAVLQALSTPERPIKKIDDLAGLNATHPKLALLMALFLFSLIGLPMTAGFVGKLMLFIASFTAPAQTGGIMLKLLAVIGAINAAIGAYYYLRIIGVMYLRTAIKPLPGRGSFATWTALVSCAVVVIWLGCYPKAAYNFTRLVLPPATSTAPPHHD